MSPVNDVVPRTSDSVTNTSSNNSAAELSAGVWSSMQSDSQSQKSGESKSDSAKSDGANGDKSPHPSTVFAPTRVTDSAGNIITDHSSQLNPSDDNRTLLNHFDQAIENTIGERHNSPVVRNLTPAFHTESQQMIRDADNLPFDRIEMDLNEQRSELKLTRQWMDADERNLLQGAQQHSPEVRQMVRDMLNFVDSPRFNFMHGENLERLRQIDPALADTLESRRGLGQQAENMRTQISSGQQLMDMPISARFRYAAELVDAGGGRQAAQAVRQLTDILNRRPEALNFMMPGSSGNRTMAELILRSNALDSKAFSHAFHRAGGNPNTLRETWARDRFMFNLD